VNQAEYGGHHLRRLRLVRVLRELAGLSISTIQEILLAMGDEGQPLHELLGIAHHALGPITEEPTGDLPSRERGEIDSYLDELGWLISPDAPARTDLARTLHTLRTLGWELDAHTFDEYVEVADRLAAWEVGHLTSASDRTTQVEQAVVGTVAFETALVALRRLAQEHHSALRFSGDPPVGPPIARDR
jgi:DNA-binding transcriptional MerR regulator